MEVSQCCCCFHFVFCSRTLVNWLLYVFFFENFLQTRQQWKWRPVRMCRNTKFTSLGIWVATRTAARVAAVPLGLEAFKGKLRLRQIFCMRSALVFAAFFSSQISIPNGICYVHVVGDGRAEQVGRWRKKDGSGRDFRRGHSGMRAITFPPLEGVLCQKLTARTGYFSVISGRIWNALRGWGVTIRVDNLFRP